MWIACHYQCLKLFARYRYTRVYTVPVYACKCCSKSYSMLHPNDPTCFNMRYAASNFLSGTLKLLAKATWPKVTQPCKRTPLPIHPPWSWQNSALCSCLRSLRSSSRGPQQRKNIWNSITSASLTKKTTPSRCVPRSCYPDPLRTLLSIGIFFEHATAKRYSQQNNSFLCDSLSIQTIPRASLPI